MPTSTILARHRAALMSNLFDAVGSQLLMLTIDLLAVAHLGFSATQVGVLNALATISFLVLAVPFGSAVDARGPLPCLMSSLVAKLVLATATLGLFATGHLGVRAAMVLSLGFGVAGVATETAQTSLAAHLSNHLEQVNQLVARMASADRVASIACPAAVGFGIAHHGAPYLLATAAVLPGVAATALARLWRDGAALGPQHPASDAPTTPNPATPVTTRGDGSVLRRWAHGFLVIASQPTLLGVTLLVTAGNIGLAIADSVETILVVRRLRLGTSFFGLMGSIGAASGLVASVTAPRLARARSLRSIFAAGGLAQAIAAALPLAAWLVPSADRALLIAFTAVWSIVVTICSIAGSAYTAATVPRASLGRASAASRTITMGSVPLAALAGGLMADHLGIAAPLMIWPALTLAAALAFIVLGRRDRDQHFPAGSADPTAPNEKSM